MGYANKFNKGNANFTYKTPEGLGYATLEELINANGQDKVYTVHALYINTKGKFGKQGVAITDEAQVNLPSHLVDVINEMRADAEAVDLINKGKIGFKIYTYNNSYGENYSVDWVDID